MWFLVVPLQLAGPFLFFLLFNERINPLSAPQDTIEIFIILGASSHIYALILYFLPKKERNIKGQNQSPAA